MSETPLHSSDVGFTPAVKEIQSRKGSRSLYARVEDRGEKVSLEENGRKTLQLKVIVSSGNER